VLYVYSQPTAGTGQQQREGNIYQNWPGHREEQNHHQDSIKSQRGRWEIEWRKTEKSAAETERK